LKQKDKLIDSLYESTFVSSSGQQPKNNINRETMFGLKIKRQYVEQKQVLKERERELTDLQRTVKNTKISELDIQLRVSMSENVRLRGLVEQYINRSGEVEVNKIKRTSSRQIHHLTQKLEELFLERDLSGVELSRLQVQADKDQTAIGELQTQLNVER